MQLQLPVSGAASEGEAFELLTEGGLGPWSLESITHPT